MSSLAFWGVNVVPKKVTDYVCPIGCLLKLSNVSLTNDAKDGRNALNIRVRDQTFPLAVLQKGVCEHASLDTVIEADALVSLFVGGDSPVGLTGFLQRDEALPLSAGGEPIAELLREVPTAKQSQVAEAIDSDEPMKAANHVPPSPVKARTPPRDKKRKQPAATPAAANSSDASRNNDSSSSSTTMSTKKQRKARKRSRRSQASSSSNNVVETRAAAAESGDHRREEVSVNVAAAADDAAAIEQASSTKQLSESERKQKEKGSKEELPLFGTLYNADADADAVDESSMIDDVDESKEASVEASENKTPSKKAKKKRKTPQQKNKSMSSESLSDKTFKFGFAVPEPTEVEQKTSESEPKTPSSTTPKKKKNKKNKTPKQTPEALQHTQQKTPVAPAHTQQTTSTSNAVSESVPSNNQEQPRQETPAAVENAESVPGTPVHVAASKSAKKRARTPKSKKKKQATATDVVVDISEAQADELELELETSVSTPLPKSAKKKRGSLKKQRQKDDRTVPTQNGDKKTPKKPQWTKQRGVGVLEQAEGRGDKVVRPGSRVRVTYVGKLANGKVFDNNIGKEPLAITVGRGEVIKGWDIGLQGMKVGGKRKLRIPASLGYGSQRMGASIPANSQLNFTVQIESIN